MSVRPSRSAARLVDTTMGGDTGWTLGGVTGRGREEKKMINKKEEIRLKGVQGSRSKIQHRGQWETCLETMLTQDRHPRPQEPGLELPGCLLSHTGLPSHAIYHPNSQSSRSSREISLATGALLLLGG